MILSYIGQIAYRSCILYALPCTIPWNRREKVAIHQNPSFYESRTCRCTVQQKGELQVFSFVRTWWSPTACQVCVRFVSGKVRSLLGLCQVCVRYFKLCPVKSGPCQVRVRLCPVCVRCPSGLCQVCVRFVSGLCQVFDPTKNDVH